MREKEDRDSSDDVDDKKNDTITAPKDNEKNPTKQSLRRVKSDLWIVSRNHHQRHRRKRQRDNGTSSCNSFRDSSTKGSDSSHESEDDEDEESVVTTREEYGMVDSLATDHPVCPICLKRYRDGDDICWSPNDECDHCFHSSCMMEWLKYHSRCPYCRRSYLKGASPSSSRTRQTELRSTNPHGGASQENGASNGNDRATSVAQAALTSAVVLPLPRFGLQMLLSVPATGPHADTTPLNYHSSAPFIPGVVGNGDDDHHQSSSINNNANTDDEQNGSEDDDVERQQSLVVVEEEAEA